MLDKKERIFDHGRPKIIVPLTGRTQEELVKQAELASHSTADIIEWRVDFYEESLNKERVKETLTLIHLELNEKPLLFSFRTKEEGGQREISVPNYKEICEVAIQSNNVQMIDFELNMVNFLGRTFVQKAKSVGLVVILSIHHLTSTPQTGEMIFQIGMMEQLGADIGKIATTANSLQDVLKVMNLKQKVTGISELPLAIMAMGQYGVVTRIAAELIGSVFTFASLADQSSAPGQLSLELMSQLIPQLAIELEK